MPPLRDLEKIGKFLEAFRYHNSGGIVWKPLPFAWVAENLDGYTDKAINLLILEHIERGGDIIERHETREEYAHHKYYYAFYISISGREIFVEARFKEGKMGPIVTIVNIHDELNL